MNQDWVNKFKKAGLAASSDELGNIGFLNAPVAGESAVGDPLGYAAPVLLDLSRLAVVDVTGADSTEFLQAQVCNDIDLLGSNTAQLNGYCNPKGRLMALFTVLETEHGLRLILPDDIAETFVKRLRMYVLRKQVTIEVRNDLVCCGLVLDGAAQNQLGDVAMPSWMPALPAEEMQITSSADAVVVRCNNSKFGENVRTRYLIIGALDTLFALWEHESMSHAAMPLWRWMDIYAGVPSVVAASVEQFIPQMLNMQLIDGLSFKKGCYPGQEIVARMQYLGKLKKNMQLFRAPSMKSAPRPGEVITTDSNNNAGQVVDAVADANGVSLLAVVNIDVQANELQLQGEALCSEPMPYSLAIDKAEQD